MRQRLTWGFSSWACVKVLIDESKQQAVADLLVREGHDALHVVAIELGGGPDDQVLAAKRDGRILVTADTDFGDLLALSGESQSSVVLLRRPGRHPEERAEAIRAAFQAVADRLESGALVVVEPHRIRIRDLDRNRPLRDADLGRLKIWVVQRHNG